MSREVLGYIAFRVNPSTEDDHYEIGKVFDSLEEVEEFFGIKPVTARAIAGWKHSVRGKQKDTWKLFRDTDSIIYVESELERRL